MSSWAGILEKLAYLAGDLNTKVHGSNIVNGSFYDKNPLKMKKFFLSALGFFFSICLPIHLLIISNELSISI